MDILKISITPQKGQAWHNFIHPYFTKQASNVVSEYIKYYSNEGDTILDPFCGTGVTAIEALELRRKVITIDINPLACFITEQTVKQIDTIKFREAFTNIYANVGKEIIRIDNANEEDFSSKKIPFWYPKGILMPSNADFHYVENLFSKKQLFGLSILLNEINKISDVDIRNQMKFVFSATISTVNLTYMPSEKGGKKVGGGGASPLGKYRYWKPPIERHLPVWDYFERRFKLILKGKEKWNKITNGFDVSENFRMINGSALEISKYVKESSVDYIYTDPPYGANIAYLDLSIMWNAWLGFDVTEQMKRDEIIEGGELQKTKENYEELFSKSFEEMGKVLKKDKWLSVVFAHKKLEFWNTIIESCEENGMEFKGSVFQPTNNSSIHWKSNPANVLCSQRVASFFKNFKKSQRQRPDDYKQYVIDEVLNVCQSLHGASLDVITNKVLDKLHNSSTDIHEFKKRGYTNIYKLLDDNPDLFTFNEENGLYYVKDYKSHQEDYHKQYYKNKDELKMFLTSILKKGGSKKLDELQNEVMEVFNEDKNVPIKHHDFFEVLKEIAKPNKKTGKWSIKESTPIELDFSKELKNYSKLIKIESDGYSHSELIYRLYVIGRYLDFVVWIGKKEQNNDSFNHELFSDISISSFPLEVNDKDEKSRVEQIDVIWFDKLNTPRYAFEVEESTTIKSGLERFSYLLQVIHNEMDSLAIVAPKRRKRKIELELSKGRFIGHPFYLENKVQFAFTEDIVQFYETHLDKEFDEIDLKACFSKFEL